jgi:hypothetical protein
MKHDVGVRALVLLAVIAACDPSLNMTVPQNRVSIEGCTDAVDHLRTCCPRFGSYISCTVLESWSGQGTPDLTAKQSHCVRATDCAALEKAIVDGKRVCGVEFRSRTCH